MPKNKTHSGASKRFKITGSGKLLRQQAGLRHLLEHKSSTLTRRLSGTTEVSKADAKTVRKLLGSLTPRIHRPTDIRQTRQGVTSGTRQAGGQRPQEAPGDPRAGHRLPRSAFAAVPQGQGAGHPLAGLQLPRPQGRKGDFRQLWIQRINAAARAERHDLQPVHPGPEGRRRRGRPQDPRRPRRQRPDRVRRARRGRQGACPTDVNAPAEAALPDATALHRASAARRARRSPPGAAGCVRPGGSPVAPSAPSTGSSSPRARRPSARRCAGRGCVVELFATARTGTPTCSASSPRRALPVARWSTTPRSTALCRDRHAAGPGGGLPTSSTSRWPTCCAARPRLVAVCADVRDPGNAGTVIRCADAAGADGVVLTGETVDLYNGKASGHRPARCSTCRSRSAPDRPSTVGALRGGRAARSSPPTAPATSTSTTPLDAGLLGRPDRLGVRQRGLGAAGRARALADAVVRVPIHGRAESLNLATAAAVCLYASRPGAPPPSGGPGQPTAAERRSGRADRTTDRTPGRRSGCSTRCPTACVVADARRRGDGTPTTWPPRLLGARRRLVGAAAGRGDRAAGPRRPRLVQRAPRRTTGCASARLQPEQAWRLRRRPRGAGHRRGCPRRSPHGPGRAGRRSRLRVGPGPRAGSTASAPTWSPPSPTSCARR